jgi:predicted metal-dependent phosphoesterase TrpH
MIDLHTHSIFSDGWKTPTELVQRANGLGVNFMALTDHDTVDGIPEFLEAAKNYKNFTPIVGCELTAGGEYDPLHILALNIKDIKKISQYTEKIRLLRLDCMKERIKLLQKAGVNINFDEVAKATVGVFMKEDLMRLMVKKGIANSILECKTYFAEGGVAYFDNKELFPDKREIIENILDAEAIPVLAHPCKLEIDGDKLHDFVKELVDMGLKGIECYHSKHTEQQIQEYLGLAREFNLIITGGSDYHAKIYDTRELGFFAPGVEIPNNLIYQIIKR